MNIMMLLEMAASGFGDRVAFVDPEAGRSLTYQELFDAAGVAAHAVRSSGANRFTMLDVSSVAIPIGLFASGWAGVPYVPINYRLTADEIAALIERVKPAYMVTEAARVEHYADEQGVDARSRDDFVTMAGADAEAADPWSMDPEETAVLLFTSGTTGAPKAAVLRHKHLVSYILSSVEFMGAEETDAALVCVPPYHVAGIAAVLSSVYSGRRVVQLANFNAETWIDVARSEKITTAFVVPTMLARIVEALEGETEANMPDLHSLSYGGGQDAATRHSTGDGTVPGHRFHQCLRTDGDELDGHRAGPGRAPRRSRKLGSGNSHALGLGGYAFAWHRNRNPRRRRPIAAGR